MEGFHLLPPEQQQEILEGPALRPPNGTYPNFDNPPNRNDVAYAVAAVTIVIATALILVRAWSRIFIVKKIRVEDVLLLCCYAFSMCHVWVLFLLVATPGYFVHQWDIRVRDLAPHIWAIHVGVNFYLAGILTGKTAILLEWLHIFNPSHERNFFFWACWITILINALFYISALLVENLHCRPYELIWDKTLEGHCVILEEYYVASAAFNLCSDLVCLILPQRVVWSLQLTRRRRIGISLIFAIGVLTCIIAALRVWITTRYIHADDQTYALSPMSLTTHIEPIGLLLVLCVPSMPMVFKRWHLITAVRSTITSWTALLSTRGSGGRGGSRDSKGAVLSDPSLQSSDRYAVYVKMDDVHSKIPSELGIVRTLDFERRDSSAKAGSSQEEFVRQHPWARD